MKYENAKNKKKKNRTDLPHRQYSITSRYLGGNFHNENSALAKSVVNVLKIYKNCLDKEETTQTQRRVLMCQF